jgi:hypothetical protein
MTWAGKQSEQPRSSQSPETYLLLTFPFIERAYLKLEVLGLDLMSGYPGGLNGSTQHLARTHLALKTKAKIAR